MNRKHRVLALFILLALSVGVWAQQQQQQSALAPERIKAHVDFLASQQMKGRGTGTPELNKAANYIANEFKRDGLEPLNGKSYFQKFRVTVGAELGKQNSATFVHGTEKHAYKVTVDWQPLNFSDSGTADVPIAFAGFGITAPEYEYDDYLHTDMTGKAVIVLRQEPQKNDEKSKFDGKEPTQYSRIVNKAINARNHGAKVMILVNDLPGAGEEDFLMKFGSLTGPENSGILLLQVKRDVVDQWLAPSGKTLAQLQKDIDEKYSSQTFSLTDAKLDLRLEVNRITAETQNVVGVLRGRDLKLAAEAIVIGAHYDHLGLGEKNSLAPSQAGKVHPGADDNASGTSVVLELARALGERKRDLRRSIVFLAFSGEELGLLGSAYYTKNPEWPLEKTAAMINLDMVGRPRDGKLIVGGVGSSPGFKQIVEKSNRTKLNISTTAGAFGGSSDHISFYVKNIPVLFFFSGLHADYHKPTDTPDKIMFADAARVGDVAMQAALTLSSEDAKPQFVRVQEAQPSGGGGGAGYGAYFGSIPDMGEEIVGVKFADVRDGSPAAKAGLKAGDVLVEFAGKEIKNLYDFTFALRAHKPGEEVDVVVLREKEKMTVKVKLEQRK